MKQRYSKLFVKWSLVLVCGFFFAGGSCNTDIEVSPEFKSGPDKGRSGAKTITLGATAVDNVDYAHGDRTDWKQFTIPGDGVVTVTIRFDNPDAAGQMVVTDETGQVLSTYEDAKRHLLKDVTFKGSSGTYYLQIWCDAADTDYSVVTNFSAI